MVYRHSWLAGFASLAFVFALLNGLIRGTIEGPSWQFVVFAGVLLGGVITWAGLTYRLPTWVVAAVNAGAALIAIARVAAPDTTWLFLPTPASFAELGVQLQQAFDLIRTGVEPVVPVRGLVIVVMVLMWALGALLVWGLERDHPYVALLPPLVVGLQLATMDRLPSGIGRIVVFLGLVMVTLLAITVDGRDQTTGRMARPGAWAPSPRPVTPGAAALLGVTMLASLLTVGVFRDTVPYDGVVTWRQSSGLTGDFFGSVSYNPFIGIQQSLIEQSDADVFVATVEGDVRPEELYFRLLTMETYGGGQFFAQRPIVRTLEQGPWELDAMVFTGPADEVTTEIQITRLRMDWLPAAYSPVNFAALPSILGSMGIRSDDGSLRFDGGRTYSGMTYTVESTVPRPDIGVLASDGAGSLSPVFAAAAADPEADNELPEPVIISAVRAGPEQPERFLDLPEELDPGIEALARRVTRNLQTPFERGLALEAFLRGPDFIYSTDIEPGHGATDLADWLLDNTSNNYRIGYCEQFATSMAVMARTLGIHSRVVLGFTPGDVLEDGLVVVRDRNAHAWVELWMPTQGWVRFDPTPRGDGVNPTTFDLVGNELGFDVRGYFDLPDPVAPDFSVTPLPLPELGDNFERFIGGGGDTTETSGLSLPGWFPIVIGLALVLVVIAGLIPGIKWMRRRSRMRRLERGDISAAWEEITARLTDLRVPPDPAASPAEAAREVDPVMAPLATVYARSVYGPSNSLGNAHVEAATTSLEQTTQLFTTKYSKGERLLALYRPGTVLPGWAKRNSKNGRRRNSNGA